MKMKNSLPALIAAAGLCLGAAAFAQNALAQNVGAGPLTPPATASAQTGPVGVTTSKSWQAMTFADSGRSMCYTQGAPAGTIGSAAGRGKAAVMVIQAPDAGAKDQVSIVLGFDAQQGKPVAVKIGRKRFSLRKFAVGRAWADSNSLDKQMVAAMKRYDWMVVNAVSAKGEKVQDTYNLSGFGDAYDAAVKACQ
ncbi:MAG TPA: invasion associated locus B family protein [Dongiaceae bacterium]|jgi:invasion protein IalB